MLGQTFSPGDLATLLALVLLECVLSVDNALVLGILAAQVAIAQRVRVLLIGLIGALVFRAGAIALAAYLIHWPILRLVGGIYLLWVCFKYFRRARKKNVSPQSPAVRENGAFWPTVAAIELTDIAFAADSILAAVALVGPAPDSAAIHPKFWLILGGGMIGIIFMRLAAAAIAGLLEKLPHLHRSAYLLVLLIGLKLIADYAVNSPAAPHRLDFENAGRVEFWVFWILMAACVVGGILPRRTQRD